MTDPSLWRWKQNRKVINIWHWTEAMLKNTYAEMCKLQLREDLSKEQLQVRLKPLRQKCIKIHNTRIMLNMRAQKEENAQKRAESMRRVSEETPSEPDRTPHVGE